MKCCLLLYCSFVAPPHSASTPTKCNQEIPDLDNCNSHYGPNHHPSQRDRSPGTHSEHFYSSDSRSLPRGLVCLSSCHIFVCFIFSSRSKPATLKGCQLLAPDCQSLLLIRQLIGNLFLLGRRLVFGFGQTIQ